MKRLRPVSLSILALALAQNPLSAKTDTLPDQAELGRNGAGDPCVAARYWDDPGAKDPFAFSYSITCRGATGSRHLGVARAVEASQSHAIESLLDCGDPATLSVPSLGDVRARRCFDKLLGIETVETSLTKGKWFYSVSAVPTAQGPAEEALRLVAKVKIDYGDRGRKVAPAINVASLAPAPAVSQAALSASDTATALEQGLRDSRAGLHMEASRVLNDALARLPADAPVNTRVELLLAAGLADSNLRFFDSAADDFKRADDLLAANPGMVDASLLANKRRTYGVLDLLNRRQFTQAVGALDAFAARSSDPNQPLLDPVTVRMLNQAPDSKKAGAIEKVVDAPDFDALSQLVINAQSAWARSVALLAENKPAEATAALAVADRNMQALVGEKVGQRDIRWLQVRIERQRARLLLRTGHRQEAVAALDKAIASLENATTIDNAGPALAETKLDRAGVIARGDAKLDKKLANFDDAVTSLIDSDAQSVILPPAVEQYLDLLVSEAKSNPSSDATERFFRALQAVGDPAIARQFVELQTVVAADPALASKVQDEQELERDLTRIRFEIENGDPQAASLDDLAKQRDALEAKLVGVQGELQANKAYGAVDDAPVTIAELRRVLQPGEAYFKLTKVRNYVFGILIDADSAQIFRVAIPVVELDPLAKLVRASIDGGKGDKIPIFEVRGAYSLFQVIAGPVADRLLAAKALIVDGSGPLESVPAGVLVTDQDSVKSFASTRSKAPYDYSQVNFLARRMPISTALSPRSLIVARKLEPSSAPLPFMGFAQHLPTSVDAKLGGQEISIGSGCEVEASAIAALTRALTPINARELDRAGNALGLANVPEVTGAEFTDTAVMARTDLDQFQVLHFATHGVTEGQWGCAKAPPALVTTFGGKGSDAILSLSEIAKLHLDANLVVLSACDTAAGVSAGAARAAGQEEAGATLEGLVRAFLAANARAVLSTYWPISNAGESEQLIEDFYGAARSGTIGEALKTAQTELITNPETSHPLYWGAFFVVGDAEKPLITGAARNQLLAKPSTIAALSPDPRIR